MNYPVLASRNRNPYKIVRIAGFYSAEKSVPRSRGGETGDCRKERESGVFNGCLCCGQPGNGHPEGAAGYIAQADLMAELYRNRIAAVLAADADVHIRTDRLTQAAGHFHETAHALLIQLGKGIRLVDLAVIIGIQELARIVTGEDEGHLGQIVGTEAEEGSFLCDFVCCQAGSGNLNHGTHFILKVLKSVLLNNPIPTLIVMTILTAANMVIN